MLPRSLKVLILASVVAITACTGTPRNVEPVTGFELDRYLGEWYEIARLDHSFERGLSSVSAEYIDEGDGIKVINRGYSEEEQKWETAEGQAEFVGDDDVGHLKVSFFGPFYSSYVVFELDQQDYQHAFVAGHDEDYLWLLARTPEVPDSLKEEFVQHAQTLGFDTDELIWVDHQRTSLSGTE